MEKEDNTRQEMIVSGRTKISDAYSMVVTPPATSITMVSTAVSAAQKMRSHLAPSWEGSGMVEEKLDITMAPDLALVDVGLVHEKGLAVAERLDALKIPFAFVTGYGAVGAFPAAWSGRPTLPKPCSTDALEAMLRRRPAAGTKR